MSEVRRATAAIDRDAQPGIPYPEVKFSNPYDQDIQTLAVETVTKFSGTAPGSTPERGEHIADLFNAFFHTFRILAEIHPVALFAVSTPLGVAVANAGELAGFTMEEFEDWQERRLAIDKKYGPDAKYGVLSTPESSSDEPAVSTVATDAN
jgi:hypothetical protein